MVQILTYNYQTLTYNYQTLIYDYQTLTYDYQTYIYAQYTQYSCCKYLLSSPTTVALLHDLPISLCVTGGKSREKSCLQLHLASSQD